ncbi:cytochrome c-type biogenesis protein [Colwellia sp. E150_009]|jgi:cytochrome c-type biogenesis protein CcmH
MLTRILGICFLIIANFIVINIVKASPVETFEFQDEVTKVRFQALSKELRCPKCQNQNLADSNSTVASALRLDLYNLLIEGRSDAEIIDLMVGRYGEFVLYRPRVSSVTYILWFGPVLLILIGVLVVIVILRKKPATKENIALDSQQQEKLKQLLQPEQLDTSNINTNNLNITKENKEK